MSSPPDRPSVGIVTVNWKSPDHTRHFAGLVKALVGSPRHLVIVNNAPGDSKALEGLEGGTPRSSTTGRTWGTPRGSTRASVSSWSGGRTTTCC